MSQQGAVLYDVPGPRARRVTTIVSLLAGLALLVGAYFLVYRPLADAGELSMDKWGPLIDPGNELFGQVWRRLGDGLRATLLAAVFAIVFSLLVGTLLAVLRLQLRQLRTRRYAGLSRPLALAARGLGTGLGWLTRVFVEVFRGAPVVITIFFVWRVLPELGLRPPDLSMPGLPLPSLMWSLVIGLTLYNGVVIGEILRSGMQGLPRGQTEAAQAIGLSSLQTTLRILLPQAYRIMLPALISQLVVVLKDTALGFIITYSEVMRTANLLAENPQLRNPLQMYAVVGVIFILVNYTLSKLAGYVERRVARGRRTAIPPPAAAPEEVAAVVR
ncbi:MAG: ABC transporter permease subunit [Micromonosporaceae bacterium]|nr:ABC transporter permease subunit [Micromonosporaceae bacterium]